MTRANARGGGVCACPHRRRATDQRPCRGLLTAAPLPAMPCATPLLLHHARTAASTLHHLHKKTCITCIKPASPVSDLHYMHQTCITCIRPESPASRVHQPHHACITPRDLGVMAPRTPTCQCFSVVSIIEALRHCLQVFDVTALAVRAPRGGDHGCDKRNSRNFGERAAMALAQGMNE